MTSETPETSINAWFRLVIDGYDLHSREDWAAVLGVNDDCLRCWLEESLTPTPEKVRALLWLLREYYYEEATLALSAWEKLKLTLVYEGQTQTYEQYVLWPLWVNLRMAVEARPAEVQEELLERFLTEARDRPPQR